MQTERGALNKKNLRRIKKDEVCKTSSFKLVRYRPIIIQD